MDYENNNPLGAGSPEDERLMEASDFQNADAPDIMIAEKPAVDLQLETPPVQNMPMQSYQQAPVQPYPQNGYQGLPQQAAMPTQGQTNPNLQDTKFCQHCGSRIPRAAVICTSCGCQVQAMQTNTPNIIVNNNNANVNQNMNTAYGKQKDKWVAFILCFFFGYLGVHKFYEGRIGSGILYLLTGGIFGIGWFIDTIILLCKPNPYYV